MAAKADGYRAKAAECDRQAKLAKNQVARHRYIDAASVWRMLADYVEPVHSKTRTSLHKTGSLNPEPEGDPLHL